MLDALHIADKLFSPASLVSEVFPPVIFIEAYLKSLYTKNQKYMTHDINVDLKEKVFENQTKKHNCLKNTFR